MPARDRWPIRIGVRQSSRGGSPEQRQAILWEVEGLDVVEVHRPVGKDITVFVANVGESKGGAARLPVNVGLDECVSLFKGGRS